MDNIWYLALSDEEMAELTGWSIQTIKKYNKSLEKKGFLEIIEVDGKKIKKFDLNPKE